MYVRPVLASGSSSTVAFLSLCGHAAACVLSVAIERAPETFGGGKRVFVNVPKAIVSFHLVYFFRGIFIAVYLLWRLVLSGGGDDLCLLSTAGQ